MDPMTLMMLISAAGSLGGAFMKDNSAKNSMKDAERIWSPDAINRFAGTYFRNFMGSPAFANAQRGVLSGSNRLSMGVAQSLGERGLNTTGIGAIAQPLANSAGSFKMGGLYSDAWQSALDAAFKSASGMTGGAATLPQPKWGAPQMYGAGLDALTKYLMMAMMQRGTGAPTGGPETDMPKTWYP